MARLVNDPADFADEAIAGFVAANSDKVVAVHGGVVRSTTSPTGEVAIVLGGGSGHYPAFAGWVGPGFAHGAACGHVFASPSASQIYSVAKAADNGGGVILGFGNYAGDVLNFGQAAALLRSEGIDARTVAISDDIASATADRHTERRGIAGDFPVFKMICSAAEAGLDIDAVEAMAKRANAMTRSLGVAFSGCSLPGADTPLFTVPDGRMAVGLGIHGEPGLHEEERPTANAVAQLLVDGVLAEQPDRSATGYDGRVALLFNGLGTVKYDELFVAYRTVAELLADASITVVAPYVGEQVTSLDMSGVSLTLTFLDPELEQHWCSPADSPAFSRGQISERPTRSPSTVAESRKAVDVGSPASRDAAAIAVAALTATRDLLADNETRLGDIDAVAGDGDHGVGMNRGSTAAAEAGRSVAAAGAGVGSVLAAAGSAWSERGGGTSGALWGAALIAFGRTLGDDARVTSEDVVTGVRSGVEAVLELGGASVGDKTLIDAAVPFIEMLEKLAGDGRTLAEQLGDAAAASAVAAQHTADIPARLGRARTHGDRSLGTPDAGAVSFSLIAVRIAQLASESPKNEG